MKVDSEEHKFSLEDLIASSSVYKERKKKIQTVFVIALLIIGAVQYFGGGLPSGQNVYFYIGYIVTPVFFAGIIASFSFFYFLLTIAIIASITPAAPRDTPNTPKLYAVSASKFPELVSIPPTCDFINETSF